jgi:hypothetical protein
MLRMRTQSRRTLPTFVVRRHLATPLACSACARLIRRTLGVGEIGLAVRQRILSFPHHDVAVFVPQFVNVVPAPLKGVVNQLAHEPSLLSQGFFVAVIRLRNFRRLRTLQRII